MSSDYQSLLGLSVIDADDVNVENINCKSFTLSSPTEDGYILTSDANGNASWKPDPNTILAGDVSGHILANVVDFVGGSSAENIHMSEILANSSTSENMSDQIVRRDANGDFSAGIITADLDGTAMNVVTNADLNGEVTSVGNTTQIVNSAVLSKVLSGFASSSGVVSAVDTILSAFGKVVGNILSLTNIVGTPTNLNISDQIVRRDSNGDFSAGIISANLNGTATNVITNANLVGEVTSIGNNTQLVNSAVISKLLTGFVSSAGTISSSDSILTAFQKLNGNIVANTGVSTATPNRLALRDGNADCSFRYVDIQKLLSNGNTVLDIITGVDNTYVGRNVGQLSTSGYYNTGTGRNALSGLTTGSANAAYGWGALQNYNGSNSCAFGAGALTAQSSGGSSSAFGYSALGSATSGSQCCAFGTEALYTMNTGSRNSGFGWRSLYFNGTGNDNTALGHYAGQLCQNGGQNTFLGSGTDFNTTTNYTNSTAIGYGAIINGSNQIRLGNTSVTNVYTSGAINTPTINTANVNASNNISATNVSTGNILGALGWGVPTSLGGAFFGWNRNSGSGMTTFANTPGLGSGGFEWINYNSTNTSFSQFMTLDQYGTLNVSNSIWASANIAAGGGVSASTDVIASRDLIGSRDLQVSGNSRLAGHVGGTFGNMTITEGPAANNSGTIVIGSPLCRGTDSSGRITLTTGTSVASSGVVVTVTYKSGFVEAPSVVITPTNRFSAQIAASIFVESYTTGFLIATSSPLATNLGYGWNYVVMGV